MTDRQTDRMTTITLSRIHEGELAHILAMVMSSGGLSLMGRITKKPHAPMRSPTIRTFLSSILQTQRQTVVSPDGAGKVKLAT